MDIRRKISVNLCHQSVLRYLKIICEDSNILHKVFPFHDVFRMYVQRKAVNYETDFGCTYTNVSKRKTVEKSV